jgi:hypothetical protein
VLKTHIDDAIKKAGTGPFRFERIAYDMGRRQGSVLDADRKYLFIQCYTDRLEDYERNLQAVCYACHCMNTHRVLLEALKKACAGEEARLEASQNPEACAMWLKDAEKAVRTAEWLEM